MSTILRADLTEIALLEIPLSPIQLLTILASVITLASGTRYIYLKLEPTVGKTRQENHLQRFWQPIVSRDGMLIITPNTEVDMLARGTQEQDFVGINNLANRVQDALADISINVIASMNADGLALRQSFLTVGGPMTNDVTGEILSQQNIVYSFEKETSAMAQEGVSHSIASAVNENQLYEPIRDPETDRIVRDFGIITKIDNPYLRGQKVVAVCGAFGWGTRAGCRLLGDEETLQYLNTNAKENLQVIFTVEIDSGGNIRDAYLLDLDPNSKVAADTLVAV